MKPLSPKNEAAGAARRGAARRGAARRGAAGRGAALALALIVAGCAPAEPPAAPSPASTPVQARQTEPATVPPTLIPPSSDDPRVGLAPGLMDAEEAIWNLRMVSQTPPPPAFVGVTNSDLAFTGDYAIQGNYNGFIVWDISNPSNPELVKGYVCPASQSDVSVYQNLLFVSGEGMGGRLDCGTQGIETAVSHERLRGIRIFDISDIRNPVYVGNVQTCRGSHTHSVLKDPNDDENVYIYVSGSSVVRPEEELPGCVSALPEDDPNSALFRIEVIRVPLDDPAAAEIVSSPRIFENLAAPPRHGLAPADLREIEEARAAGGFVIEINGVPRLLRSRQVDRLLEEIVEARGGAGAPTAADSAALRRMLPELAARMSRPDPEDSRGPTQCHDITLYPEIGLGGGACEGYGLLLDIEDPTNPRRIDAVADSNFSYWHSATFNNDGTKVLFTDEWGGGGSPKCRATDPYEWGADAIFTIENGELVFQSYYKMPAPQTNIENCVAHNGSLIPIPGRDIMVQSWYQGGISMFDWTDPENPFEIAFHDRGPSAADRQGPGGSWSVYWYNGAIVSSEIARGLDVFQLVPSEFISQNEIDAARTVELDYLNAQGQPHFEWPASFALARAYIDQLERNDDLAADRIAAYRRALAEAERAPGARRTTLFDLAGRIQADAAASGDARKMRTLAEAVRKLADAQT